ncbi:MAG: hypothetical protein ACW972_02075 [Promethearchaeota archaeon]
MKLIKVLKVECPSCESTLVIDVEKTDVSTLDESDALKGICPACQAEIIFTIEGDNLTASIINPSPSEIETNFFSNFQFLKDKLSLGNVKVSIQENKRKTENKSKGLFSKILSDKGFDE